MGKALNKHFLKAEMQMAMKYKKRCSLSLTKKEMHIKTTMRIISYLFGWLPSERQRIAVSEEGGKKGALAYYRWGRNLVWARRKPVWRTPQKD